MAHITLPATARGERIVGGIVFTDGPADVPDTRLGPNTRAFLTGIGATITSAETPAEPEPESPSPDPAPDEPDEGEHDDQE